VHISLIREQDLIATLDEAAPIIRKAFEENPQHCTVSFISGPSRTGDIAMQLTLGVHGPQESIVVVIRNS
jgi:L-lactate dehydrogenase complex protein LldG